MKAPVGLLSDRTVLRSKMEGPCPDKFTLTRLDFCGNLSQQFNITYRNPIFNATATALDCISQICYLYVALIFVL